MIESFATMRLSSQEPRGQKLVRHRGGCFVYCAYLMICYIPWGIDNSAVTIAILATCRVTSVGFQDELPVSSMTWQCLNAIGLALPTSKKLLFPSFLNGVTKTSPEIPKLRVLSVGSWCYRIMLQLNRRIIIPPVVPSA